MVLIYNKGESKVKFDLVIGNPPYQSGNQSIYQDFITTAIEIRAKNIVMITKNNWMVGKTLEDTRNKMIEYGIEKIINYPINKEIFKDVNVAVSIFALTPKDYDGQYNIEYVEIRNGLIIRDDTIKVKIGLNIETDEIAQQVINKVIQSEGFKEYNLAKNARVFSIASNGYFMHSTWTEQLLVYSDKPTSDNDIEVVFMDGKHNPLIKYTDYDKLPKGKESVYKYKVICGSKAFSNNIVTPTLLLLEPGQIMTNSWGIIGIVDSEIEGKSLLKYAKTKFFRYLLRFAVSGDRVTFGPGCTCYIPMQMLDNTSDIDWSTNLDNIDIQLYKKYDLTDEEIRHIECTITKYDN